MSAQNNPKKVSSQVLHQNPYFAVRKDNAVEPDGSKGEYFVVTKNHSVFIVPVTDKNEVVLVKLFRYMTQQMSVELPAGGRDGQEPLVAAKRELQEETGYKAGNWKHLGRIQGANGISDQMFDVYLATQLKQTNSNEQEEEGITEVLRVPLAKAKEMVKTGEISDLGSVGALFMALQHLDQTP